MGAGRKLKSERLVHLNTGNRMLDGSTARLCRRRVDRERHLHAPAAFGVGLDEPVRMNHDRLMHQLEAGFRLADGFDRKGPHAARPIDRQVDVDAEPFVGEAQSADVRQIEPRAELAEPIVAGVAEVAIVGAGRQAGEVELDAEVERLAGRQPFEQVGDFERVGAASSVTPLVIRIARSPTRPSRISCTCIRSGLRRSLASYGPVTKSPSSS